MKLKAMFLVQKEMFHHYNWLKIFKSKVLNEVLSPLMIALQQSTNIINLWYKSEYLFFTHVGGVHKITLALMCCNSNGFAQYILLFLFYFFFLFN